MIYLKIYQMIDYQLKKKYKPNENNDENDLTIEQNDIIKKVKI